MNRQEFLDWFYDVIQRAIPDNFEDYTKDQLVSRAFEIVFDELDARGMVPKEDS